MLMREGRGGEGIDYFHNSSLQRLRWGNVNDSDARGKLDGGEEYK